MNKNTEKIIQRACYNRIWSWSPMPCEKHGPRASVRKKNLFFVYWVPLAMFFTRHGRPWSNPTPHASITSLRITMFPLLKSLFCQINKMMQQKLCMQRVYGVAETLYAKSMQLPVSEHIWIRFIVPHEKLGKPCSIRHFMISHWRCISTNLERCLRYIFINVTFHPSSVNSAGIWFNVPLRYQK